MDNKLLIGLFADSSTAEKAISELEASGFNAKDLSIIMKDKQDAQRISENTGATVAGGAASGATTGAVIGGLAGLLIGVGAITIPGIGALLIGGPLAAALGLSGAAATTASGALTGALAGGLVGALVSLGVPEEEARVYQEQITAGAILLAVPVSVSKEEEARAILDANSAQQIRVITLHPAQQ